MAEYEKDTEFSWGWCVGGAALVFVTQFLGGFIAIGAGVTNVLALYGVAIACYAVTGFVIGWKSEGRTILEGGIAAVLAIAIAMALKGISLAVVLDPLVAALGIGATFGAAVLGAFVGEQAQGNFIHRSDD
jgi:hypothetical protein